MSRSTTEHRAQAPTRISFALLTISTSRYRERQAGQLVDDPSGEILTRLIEEAGYTVVYSDIIPDDEDLITRYLERIVQMPMVNVLITCGGTGITTTDTTIETVSPLLDKELPGFGEIFRKLSYEIIGSAAIITRATAGILNGKVVFCLPGSPQAVELALTRLIIPEVGHLTKHARE